MNATLKAKIKARSASCQEKIHPGEQQFEFMTSYEYLPTK